MADKNKLTKNQKVALAVGAGVIVLIWLLGRRAVNVGSGDTIVQGGSVVEGGDVSIDDKFKEPYFINVPGTTEPIIIWGDGGAPYTDITVNIPDSMYGSLSRQYIPMFGFVGISPLGA